MLVNLYVSSLIRALDWTHSGEARSSSTFD